MCLTKEPKWNRPYMVAIRVILIPVAFILHLIPHVTGLIITLYRWVRYGGEFIVYTHDDKPSIAKIFDELKKEDSSSTNDLLEKILKECKRNSDLVEAYNRKYHV